MWRYTLTDIIRRAGEECQREQISLWIYLRHDGKPMYADCHPGWGWQDEAKIIIAQLVPRPDGLYNILLLPQLSAVK